MSVDKCNICMEDFEETGHHRVASLNCGHIFGHSCIRCWLSPNITEMNNQNCPQCNSRADSKDIHLIHGLSFDNHLTKQEFKKLLEQEQLKAINLFDELTQLKSEKEELENMMTKVEQQPPLIQCLMNEVRLLTDEHRKHWKELATQTIDMCNQTEEYRKRFIRLKMLFEEEKRTVARLQNEKRTQQCVQRYLQRRLMESEQHSTLMRQELRALTRNQTKSEWRARDWIQGQMDLSDFLLFGITVLFLFCLIVYIQFLRFSDKL
ncbi:E3 ubiquitin-protein ligase trul-1-like [Phlebotomus argentipes]|uniref:E3 ubiquitin-protein ligase trul-1-like n=1 Tax=Phlebotomus argentipes TaxID=94469 RepID=UPI0028932175|nr:E3 ubiquitin-protein ligase trul-1-like [Phlebotomus argentipes]